MEVLWKGCERGCVNAITREGGCELGVVKCVLWVVKILGRIDVSTKQFFIEWRLKPFRAVLSSGGGNWGWAKMGRRARVVFCWFERLSRL